MDRVEAFVDRLAPAAICDDRIVDRLGLGAPHQVRLRTANSPASNVAILR